MNFDDACLQFSQLTTSFSNFGFMVPVWWSNVIHFMMYYPTGYVCEWEILSGLLQPPCEHPDSIDSGFWKFGVTRQDNWEICVVGAFLKNWITKNAWSF